MQRRVCTRAPMLFHLPLGQGPFHLVISVAWPPLAASLAPSHCSSANAARPTHRGFLEPPGAEALVSTQAVSHQAPAGRSAVQDVLESPCGLACPPYRPRITRPELFSSPLPGRMFSSVRSYSRLEWSTGGCWTDQRGSMQASSCLTSQQTRALVHHRPNGLSVPWLGGGSPAREHTSLQKQAFAL